MKTHLFINVYQDKNFERNEELIKVFKNNLDAGFDEISIICEEKDKSYCIHLCISNTTNSKLSINTFTGRPPFQMYIDMANIEMENENTIFIVCNSDIYITPDNLEKFKNLPWEKNLFVALSRHDITKLGNLVHLERWDSQDFFAWKNKCLIESADCPIGFPGSDNGICYKFKEKGYQVINPSKDLITCHLHNIQNTNNYRDEEGNVKADQICPEPYHLITPHFIKDI